ncbi:MAG: aldo/keto reductase [Spirochaetaceae bacterium]|jgi:predicted aldo/keto reductase-like oxidoreductase|nr:aldo/keto reductase [Spirochaetaceae bacterium]
MQYREDKVSGNKISILGLGCMRFSRNFTETERMILTAIEGGVNYFDTAYIYPNNEKTLGTVLDAHKKRGGVFIATKLPLILCKNGDDFDKFFNKQLENLKTDHIDYYLMHMITDLAQWEKLVGWGIEDWIARKKHEGRIRQAGFSFHGAFGEFIKTLNAYPWDFCQIQYNYSNENYQAGKEGLKAAFAKNIPVIIMEPLLGGRLAAGLPASAIKIFAEVNPTLTPAAWALRWLWAQNETACVLSGSNSAAQMEENLKTAEGAGPLAENELAAYEKVKSVFAAAYKINCTGCNYCMPCPKGVNIPGCFAAYNASFAQNFKTGMQQFLTSAGLNGGSPYFCVNCGKCETHCPQKLPVRKTLKEVARRLEPAPIHLALSIARKFLR